MQFFNQAPARAPLASGTIHGVVNVFDFPDLSRLVRPRNIVVVGGSQRPNTEGAFLLDNLARHSKLLGEVYVVNPSMPDCGVFQCWPSLAALPEGPIDVALVIVRASLVLDVLRDCARRQIPFAIVMSSGFAETGQEGKTIEAEIAALCAETGLRVYGPNCPGLTNMRDRIGMTFSTAFAADAANVGPIGLVTQGGGAGRSVIQGFANGPGAGLWFSGGNELDLGAPDFIAHLAMDPAIEVIAVVLEGIRHGKRLIAALELARANGKPVVALKVGRSEYGVRAAQSHTGSIAGAAEINKAVFRQFGVVEVDDLDELVAVTRLLAARRRPASASLAILTFSGGAAAMAADHTGIQGLQLAEFTPQTLAHLKAALPAFAAIQNPVDVTSEAVKSIDALVSCLCAVAADPHVGAVLVPVPADYGEATERIAQAIIDAAANALTPIIPVWMSRRQGAGFDLLERHGLAPFTSLSKAIAAIRKAVPRAALPPAGQARAVAAEVPAHAAGVADIALTACNEATAKRMLRDADIPVPAGILAGSAKEAAEIAARLGFPVAMKVASAQILHKTEVDGVRLGIASQEQAAAAYASILERVGALRPDARIDGILVEKMFHDGGREMLVGIHTDEAFGRVMTVGLGGIFVELMKDVSHRVLPIRQADALEMIGELRYGAYLGEFRGHAPADVEALADLLGRISEFAMNHPEIQEAEFNPVWVGPKGEGAFALDALILSTPAEGAEPTSA